MNEQQSVSNMETMTQKLEVLFQALEDKEIKIYLNEEDCNSCSCARAERDGIDDFVYLHEQACDSLKETGKAFLGWDVDNPKIITDIVDSIEGLEWRMESPNSKVEVYEPYDWQIIDDEELEAKYLDEEDKDELMLRTMAYLESRSQLKH